MYRISKHSLAIEKCHRRHKCLSREDRLCAPCPQKKVETELHFLTSCQMYDNIRDTYLPQITLIHKEFEIKSNFDKLPYLLVETPQCAITAARFVTCCHNQWQPVKNKHHCKFKIYLFSFLYFNYLHIVTALYTMTVETSLFLRNTLCAVNV